MIEQSTSGRGTRVLIIAATLVIIISGVNQAQSVAALFLVSVFLALLGTPAVLWLDKKHIPRIVSVMIVMVCMVAVLLIVGGVLGASLSTFADALPVYQKRLHEELLALKAVLAGKHIIISEKTLLVYLNPGAVMSLTTGLLTAITFAPDIVLVLLTVTFILLEASSFPVKVRSVLGDPALAFPQVTRFINDIRRYMVIKTLLCLGAGVILGLWLFILGVDYPLLWGFLAFLLYYVPTLGSIMAAIPAVLLAFLELGMGPAALAAAGYLVVGSTLGNIVEPRLMGRQLGLSTLVVFLSVVCWGSLLGPAGVVLCVPLTMSLKFAFESNESTRWIAVLLGSEATAVKRMRC